MKTLAISITAISLFLYGCGNNADQKSNEPTDTVKQEEHQHDSETKAIELNNGEKWKVDSNMMVYIRSMENDVDAFGKAEQKDYKALSEKLQANVNLLTSNCTMKGTAHDELHKWLLPYIDIVDGLSNAQGEAEAGKKLEEIQSSFVTFHQFFE